MKMQGYLQLQKKLAEEQAIQNELATLRTQVNTLQSGYSEKDNQIASFQSQVSGQHNSLLQKDKEIAELKRKGSEVNTVKLQLNNQFNQLLDKDKEIDKLKLEIIQLKGSIQTFQETIKHGSTENNILLQTIEELKTDKKELKDDKEYLKLRISSLEQEIGHQNLENFTIANSEEQQSEVPVANNFIIPGAVEVVSEYIDIDNEPEEIESILSGEANGNN